MIKTAFCSIPQKITEEDIKKETASLPHFLCEKNTAYIDEILSKKHRPSVLRSLMALKLLGSLIADLGISPRLLRTDLGRPYFDSIPNMDFSISHSEGLAVCALCISDDPSLPPRVGIDCETIYTKDPLPLARRFFSESELKILESSEDQALAFTEIWTKKEAYIKLLGTGLSTPLASFCVNNLPQQFKTERIANDLISVCAESRLFG
ncbi:MAG: 4'-phosphopantetheinyl transferase superfamily protein [Clostridia bacterium]|nr:4'-phosphopantetheinyl transferase superfamily protein [Clostridia bacterium]